LVPALSTAIPVAASSWRSRRSRYGERHTFPVQTTRMDPVLTTCDSPVPLNVLSLASREQQYLVMAPFLVVTKEWLQVPEAATVRPYDPVSPALRSPPNWCSMNVRRVNRCRPLRVVYHLAELNS